MVRSAQLPTASPFNYHLPDLVGTGVDVVRHPGPPGIALHYHPAYEMVLVRGSSGKRLVGDTLEAYRDGDFVLLGPNLPHAWIRDSAPGNGEMVVALFTRGSLGLDLLERTEMTAVRLLLNRAERGLVFPSASTPAVQEDFAACITDDPTERLFRFLLVLHRLARGIGAQTLVSPGYRGGPGEHDHRNFVRVIEHLQHHGDQRLSLAGMADLLGMSIPTFTRFFRRMTGCSFVDYLNRWRIERACVLLRETDDSILAISYRIGYGNLSHFNRQFKRLRGITPKRFRREG